jgi:hypothetical protein
MVTTTDSLERQLRFYETQSESAHQRQDDAAWAEIQEVVALANFVFGRIKRIDEEWSGELAAAGKAPSEGDALALERLYVKWCAKAELDLRRATELDAKGFKIVGLDRFRQAYYEAKDILSIPTDRVRRAAQDVEEGRSRPLGAIRDELRRKLNA